jgi:hypothetical protein
VCRRTEVDVALRQDHAHQRRLAGAQVADDVALLQPAPGQVVRTVQQQGAGDRRAQRQPLGFVAQPGQHGLLARQVLLELLGASLRDAPGGVELRLHLLDLGRLGPDARRQPGLHRLQHRLAGGQRRAGGLQHLVHEARAPGAQDGALGKPQHPFADGVVRQRQYEDQQRQQHAAAAEHGADAAAAAGKTRRGEQRPQPLAQRPDHRHPQRPGGDEHADDEELLRHQPRDGQRHEQPIGIGQGPVADEPAPLADRGRRALGTTHAEQPTLGQVLPVAVGTRAEVGDLDGIGEDEVAVVAQQRVGVEEQRRHAGQHGHVVGQRARQSGLQRQPEVEGQRRQEEFGQHAGRTDQRALPLVGECRRVGDIDIGHRVEDEQHDAHLVHLGAAHPADQAVRQLVHDLDAGEQQRQRQQVVGREQPLGTGAGEFLPMRGHQQQRRHHDQQPQQHAGPAQQRPEGPRQRAQQRIGIEQRDAQRHRVADTADPLARCCLR